MLLLCLLWMLLLLFLPPAFSLSVLAYIPLFGHSHIKFLGRISDILIEAGHQVTIIAPICDATVGREVSKGAEMLYIDQTPITAKNWGNFKSGRSMDAVWKATAHPLLTILPLKYGFSYIYDEQCKPVLASDVLKKLKGRHFDVAFSEPFDTCGFAIFHLLGIRKYVIAFSTITYDGISDITGVATAPSYVPSVAVTTDGDMGFFARVENAVAYTCMTILTKLMHGVQDVTFAKYGVPPIREVMADASLVFMNAEALIDFPRPTAHRVVDIGGIGITEPKPVNETWSSLLSLRPRTVLISFGSLYPSYQMPRSYKVSIREVAKSFPDTTFIWKYEKHEEIEPLDNLVLSTWLPQNDLLNDGRLSAFVTHGGAASILEVARAGVPTVAIPLASDQIRNSHSLVRLHTAIALHKTQLDSPGPLRSALQRLFDDRKYRQRAEAIKQQIVHQPFSPKEKVLRNFEFVARYGPLPHLQHAGRRMSVIEYYLIDVVAFLVVTVAVIVTLIIKLLRMCIRLLCYRIRVAKRKNE